MDKYLVDFIKEITPKINPKIGEGLAYAHVKEIEQYIDQVFSLAARGFPEGLVYQGYKRCTHEEEFAQRTRRRENRCVYDIAPSSIYMMKYQFAYKGEPLPSVYMYLPYLKPGGIIEIAGSQFAISPVLSDRVISVGLSNVFVRLLRGKVTFMRLLHPIRMDYLADDRLESIQVIYGMIYNKNQKQQKYESTVSAKTALAHYLFCKFGVTETFRRYAHCEVVISEEIDTEKYPIEDWVICKTLGQRQKGRLLYEASNIKVAVPRSKAHHPLVKQLIGGFFYITDFFPQQVLANYVDDVSMWKVLLGHILLSGKINHGILLSEMEDHISSLDEYIDRPVAVKLKDIGIDANDFYDFMIVVMQSYGDWVVEAKDKINSMYDKELSVLYYICYEITSAIFKMYFKLQAASKKDLSFKEVAPIFKAHLKPGLIFSIRKLHGEVSAFSYSGDNKVLKLTSALIPQTESNRLKSRRGRGASDDPAKRLHVSVAEVGNYSNIPKAEPSGRSRLNPMVQIDDKNVIVRNPKFVELLDQIQQDIK